MRSNDDVATCSCAVEILTKYTFCYLLFKHCHTQHNRQAPALQFSRIAGLLKCFLRIAKAVVCFRRSPRMHFPGRVVLPVRGPPRPCTSRCSGGSDASGPFVICICDSISCCQCCQRHLRLDVTGISEGADPAVVSNLLARLRSAKAASGKHVSGPGPGGATEAESAGAALAQSQFGPASAGPLRVAPLPRAAAPAAQTAVNALVLGMPAWSLNTGSVANWEAVPVVLARKASVVIIARLVSGVGKVVCAQSTGTAVRLHWQPRLSIMSLAATASLGNHHNRHDREVTLALFVVALVTLGPADHHAPGADDRVRAGDAVLPKSLQRAHVVASVHFQGILSG